MRHLPLRSEGHLPGFDGATEWLNSAPLSPAGLAGNVVLVDFWTLTCINWLRTEPYIRAWSEAYSDSGLVVVGVHTPEFSFEHEIERVRRATTERAIDYPVALDNDYAVWSAFANHYWPALYFADREGVIRDHHFGEGRYERSERLIQQLLGIERDLVSVEALGVEAEADWENLRSPETYLGYTRGGGRSALEDLQLNEWALAGEWKVDAEKIVAERANAAIVFRFHARDAHVVLSHNTIDPIPFRVLIDGDAPGDAHGVDVDGHGDGILEEGRLYQLVRQRDDVRQRTLEITFSAPGAEAYVFTFG